MNFKQFEDEDNYYDDDFDNENQPNEKQPARQKPIQPIVSQTVIKNSQSLYDPTGLANPMKEPKGKGKLNNDSALSQKNILPSIETKKSMTLDLSIKNQFQIPETKREERRNIIIENSQTNRNDQPKKQATSKIQKQMIDEENNQSISQFQKPRMAAKSQVKNAMTAEFDIGGSPELSKSIKFPKTSANADNKHNSRTQKIDKSNVLSGIQKNSILNSQRQDSVKEQTLPSQSKFDSKPNLLKGGKGTSSTPNLQSSQKYQQSMVEAKQYLTSIQNAAPNFVKKNIETLAKGSEISEFQTVLDFIEKTRRKITEFRDQSEILPETEEDQSQVSLQLFHNKLQDFVKYSMLSEENNFLSTAILDIKKKIDDIFNKHDPMLNSVKQHPCSDSRKFQPTEDQLKIRDREIENANKQLQVVIQEYQKILERVEQVRSPTFLGDLHDQLNELKDSAKEQEKENKYRLIAQQKRDSVIDKMLQEGAPKSIFRIKELQDKLASVKEGVKKQTNSKAKYFELMESLDQQSKELKIKEQKCLKIAKTSGIKFSGIEEINQAVKAQLAKEKELKFEKKNMDRQIQHQKLEQNLSKKKTEMQEKQNIQRIKELMKGINEMKDQMQWASNETQDKNIKIQELIETLKQKGESETGGDGFNKTKKRPVKDLRSINYDAVQKAIEEMNIKESHAALIVQKNYRMLVQKRKYQEELNRKESIRKQEEILSQIQEDSLKKNVLQEAQNEIGTGIRKAQVGSSNSIINGGGLGIDSTVVKQNADAANDSVLQNQPSGNKIGSKPNLLPRRRVLP